MTASQHDAEIIAKNGQLHDDLSLLQQSNGNKAAKRAAELHTKIARSPATDLNSFRARTADSEAANEKLYALIDKHNDTVDDVGNVDGHEAVLQWPFYAMIATILTLCFEISKLILDQEYSMLVAGCCK